MRKGFTLVAVLMLAGCSAAVAGPEAKPANVTPAAKVDSAVTLPKAEFGPPINYAALPSAWTVTVNGQTMTLDQRSYEMTTCRRGGAHNWQTLPSNFGAGPQVIRCAKCGHEQGVPFWTAAGTHGPWTIFLGPGAASMAVHTPHGLAMSIPVAAGANVPLVKEVPFSPPAVSLASITPIP